MSRLYLVRHGPTHAKCMVGWSDLPADLSDHRRIAALSAHLPATARLVSSDLIRTRSTADALQAPGRSRLPDAPALREIHFGDWEMLTANEIEARDPDLSRAYWTDPGEIAPPGGESWNAMVQRSSAALDALMAAGGDVIAVCHFAVILGQVARHRGAAPREVLRHRIEPLSVTRIDYAPGGLTQGAAVGPINQKM